MAWPSRTTPRENGAAGAPADCKDVDARTLVDKLKAERGEEGEEAKGIVDTYVLCYWLEAKVCARLSELDRKLSHIEQCLHWCPEAANASDILLSEAIVHEIRASPRPELVMERAALTTRGSLVEPSIKPVRSLATSAGGRSGASTRDVASEQSATALGTGSSAATETRDSLQSSASKARFAMGNKGSYGSQSTIMSLSTLPEGVTEERRNSFRGLHSRLMARKKYQKSGGDAVWSFLEDPESGVAAGYYEKFVCVFILLTVLVALLQTGGRFFPDGLVAVVTEASIEVIFAVEIIVRFAACPAKLAFLASRYTVVDFLSICPLPLRIYCNGKPELLSGTVVTGILFGIVPVLRLSKLLRHFQKLHLLMKAFQLAFEALPAMIFLYMFLVLLFTVVVFLVEPRWNVPTLPAAMWLTFVSMTTLGYGDLVPDSTAGRWVIGFLTVISMLYMTIPLGIIGNAFSEVWRMRDRILLTRRFRMRLLQWGYRGQDMPKLFQIFDRDGDGELNLSEFKRMIRDMGLGLDSTRILELFELFDNDGSGAVDDRELVKGLFPESFALIYAAGSEECDGSQEFDLTQRLAFVDAEIAMERESEPVLPTGSTSSDQHHIVRRPSVTSNPEALSFDAAVACL